MGYIPQDQFLFATSILDNIPLSLIYHFQRSRAAKLAQVYQDIVDAPQVWYVDWRKGVSLSGGQKQRLTGRAMILDPDILILDDSLSAVDEDPEYAIIDNLKGDAIGQDNHYHGSIDSGKLSMQILI